MNRLLIALILGVILFTTTSSQVQRAEFELVESVPIETDLDNPDLRNTLEVWLEMIEGATKTLDIEEFYISNEPGEPLEEVIEAILRAAARGVSVRVISDARMYNTYPETLDRLGKETNIQVRIIDYGKLAGGVQHAKFFIVDRQHAFVGSQNFDWRALKHIQELGVRLRHTEAVRIYQDIFDLDWDLAAKNDPASVSKLLTRKSYPRWYKALSTNGDTISFMPTCSPKGIIPDTSLWDETHIVSLIDRATSEVFCNFLSYTPIGRDKSFYPAIENAFRRAAARGVKVRMVVADWSKGRPTVDYLKSLSLIPNIEVKFSVIPEWTGGYIPYSRVNHCKFLVIDGSASWIGTSNWEKSYFYTSRNLGMIIENATVSGIIRRIFLKNWDGPYTEPVRAEVEYQPREHRER